jgi:hypothetical protein
MSHPFQVRDGNLVRSERADDFLQREPVLAHLDKVVKQLRLLSAQPVLQRDQQAA